MAKMFEFEIKGLDKMQARLEAARVNVNAEVASELFRFASDVMTISKEERVPVDTGALRATGKVMLPVWEGNRVTVTMGYGDEAVNYAVYVHENLSPGVHWTRPGSGPKYLENPLKENIDQLPDRIAAAVRRGLKG